MCAGISNEETPCDDDDPCTINDAFRCQVCIGDPLPDSDDDGECDVADPCPNLPFPIGHPCDDGNPCTANDTYINCNLCAGISNEGKPCDDGDPCTINDAYRCQVCIGDVPPNSDSDGDGVCDERDVCPGEDDNLNGMSCDDGDPCTIITEIWCGECTTIFPVTPVDSDGDGLCDQIDPCPISPSNNIDNYVLLSTQSLPRDLEVSGLTYNNFTKEFIAVDDDGVWLRRSPSGIWSEDLDFDVYGPHCDFDRFSDVEGIAYLDADGFTDPTSVSKYAIADERDRTIAIVEIANSQTTISHPPKYVRFEGLDHCNNFGIQGIAFDLFEKIIYFATEHSDQIIYSFSFPALEDGAQEIVPEILVDLSTVPDLSTFSTHGLAVFANGNILALVTKPGTGDNGSFQRMVLEFDTCGDLIGTLDLEPNVILDTDELEGITLDEQFLYLIGENDVFYQLGPPGSNVSNSSQGEESSSFKNAPSLNGLSNLIGVETIVNSPVSIYPNPFSNQVKIDLDLLEDGPMRIDVIDVSGRLVKTVAEQDEARKGNHVFDVEGVDLETGLYFVRIQAGKLTETKKITKL